MKPCFDPHIQPNSRLSCITSFFQQHPQLSVVFLIKKQLLFVIEGYVLNAP